MTNLLTFPTAISDATERQRALDTTQSFIVEAPAGSGKTGLLVQRFLKLLALVDDPAEVLAITFTRKATAELRDRVLSQLAAAHAGTPPPNHFDAATRPFAQAVLAHDARLGWNLLDQPHRLHIRTIDAVSRDIASALPVLSGAAAALAPTEDAATLHAEAARRTVLQLGGPDPLLSAALEDILLHRDGNLQNCETLITEMLANRDQWADLIPLASSQLTDAYLEQTVLPKLNRALDLLICRGLTLVSKALPPGFLDDLCTLAADMGHADGYNGDPSPLAFCAGNRIPPEEKSAHLHHWIALVDLLLTSGGKFRKRLGPSDLRFIIDPSHKQELARLTDTLRDNDNIRQLLRSIGTLPPATYPPNQWRVAKSLFRVLAHALAQLQLVFAARTACDFAEIALLARAALRHDTALYDLAATSGARLQHLLVDEMQDTSTSQYELIHLLTEQWDGHSQTLFLVGDPKQSIYLFRQARVERFVRTLHDAARGHRFSSGPDALRLTSLHLSANFRSQPPLVHAFNQTFSLIFPTAANTANPEQISYQEVHAAREPNHRPPELHFPVTRLAPRTVAPPQLEAAPLTWHANPIPNTTDPEARKTARSTQVRAHAREIRGLVKQWRNRPLPPGRTAPWKIAVLVQARTHLPVILQAFKQQPSPIPYRAVDIEPLAERQEILDLLALTRALLHPADRTAWLALLRAPLCGLTLADLHRLAGQDDRAFAQITIFELIRTRGDLLSEDAIARLQPFWTIMGEAQAQRGCLPLAQWVARTWRAFAVPSFSSPEELSNAETYFALLDKLETSSGSLDLPLLNERLKKLYATPSADPAAVDLMTIHKAKGLEWDFVIVPALDRTVQNSRPRLLDWLEVQAEPGPSSNSEDEIAHGILAPIKAKGDTAGKLNSYIRQVESSRAAAERKRLFYVACTRAREELHLFAAPNTNKDGGLYIHPGSLLSAAWPAAEPHFTNAAARLLQLPSPTPTFALAAAAAARPPRIIHRIPLINLGAADSDAGPSASTRGSQRSLFPSLNLGAPSIATPSRGVGSTPPSSTSAPTRPQGSFAARTFGNTLHAFLQSLTIRIASGEHPADLRANLESWSPRIAALLRSYGLPPAEIPALTQSLLRALTRTLDDPQGRWILAPHPGAATEQALTAHTPDDPTPQTIRLDRTFLAGPIPLAPGETHRWIIDYKTATHAEGGIEAFLERERQTYASQLQTYAARLASPPATTRLALYYPLLSRLLWWTIE